VALDAPGNVAEPGGRRRGGVPPRRAEVARVLHLPLLIARPRPRPRRRHSIGARARGHQRPAVVAGVRHGHGDRDEGRRNGVLPFLLGELGFL